MLRWTGTSQSITTSRWAYGNGEDAAAVDYFWQTLVFATFIYVAIISKVRGYSK